MAFNINETGIEQGATQVLFDDPPIILDRHEEGGPDRVFEVAIPGNPIGVEYTRDQAKTFERIRVRLMTAAQVATLETLIDGGGVMVVKLTPGSATTIQCLFGPRDEMDFHLYNEPIPNATPAGGTIPALLTQYRVDLLLLRLE